MNPNYFSDEAKRLCDALTTRQREVLVLTCKGCVRDEVAARLGMGRRTLDSHTKAIYRALDVTTAIEAAVIATKAGLV